MPFKKLIPPLKEALNHKGFETALPFQKQILPKIKGGANVFGVGPEGCGKTTTLILSVIQKLKGEAIDDSPRALIFVKDKQAALDLALEFNAYTRGTDLRVYCAYDEHHIELQREEIYLGTDIVIATPKRLNKIFFLNGIHLGQLKICIVEDAQLLLKGSVFGEISRTPESIGRCQYLVFSTTYDSRFERWRDTFMINSQIVKFIS